MKYARIYKLNQKNQDDLSLLKISPNFEAIPEGEEELALQKKIPNRPFLKKKKLGEGDDDGSFQLQLQEQKSELAEIEEKVQLSQKKYEGLIAEKAQFLVEEKQKSEIAKTKIIEEAELEKTALIESAKLEKQNILDEAKAQAGKVISEAEKQREAFEADGREAGRVQGQKIAQEEASADIQRLQDWLQKAALEVHEERARILAQTERDVVQLCRVSIRKIVKQLSESDEKLIIRNVTAALAMADKHSDLKIRVHPDDLALCKKYSKDFIKQVEIKGNMRFAEDPSIEQGGCFVESNLGAIDARISSQLHEIEMSLAKVSTVKPKAL